MMMMMKMMIMVYNDDALWQLASVSGKKQAAAVHGASPMPRFIWRSSMRCMAGTVHTQHLIRAQSGQAALLQPQTCKKWGKVKHQRHLGIDFSWSLQLDSLVTQADFLHLLTWDVIFQQEKDFIFATCKKKKKKKLSDIMHQSLLCQLSSILQATWYHFIMGLREKRRLAGWRVVQLCPESA